MKFDKNQSVFPSDFHREVWWWAIGLVPPEDSLTEAVLEKCSQDILDGCYQWHSLFNKLCGDMYKNAPEYIPAPPRRYRDILENIALKGTIQAHQILYDLNAWEAYENKINKSKAYASSGISLQKCLAALKRTGLKYKRAAGGMIFEYKKYPQIFHAMQTMQNSPNARDTPVRNHFAHCEFRQLFKRYDANYNELLRRANDDSLYIAHAVHDFAKSLKIQRYIHFGIIKYKYKNIRVLDIDLHADESPAMRINIGKSADPDALNSGKIHINPVKSDLESVLNFIAERKASIDQYY